MLISTAGLDACRANQIHRKDTNMISYQHIKNNLYVRFIHLVKMIVLLISLRNPVGGQRPRQRLIEKGIL